MTLRALSALALCLVATSPNVALAQAPAQRPAATATPSPTKLGDFGNWTAYSVQAGGARQCYVLGTPQASEPRDIQPGSNRRGATNLFITHRPGQNVRNEVSIMIGYVFRANANASIEVVGPQGTRRFPLFTREQGAWLQNAAEEAQFVEAVRRGREMVVRGTSQRGTATVDRYSLNQIAGALDRIAQDCRN
jgi:hypothetical protein